MDILILVAAMVVVGLIVGALAGLIWKGQRPIGLIGDLVVAVVTAVAVGLIDWFVIPAMGFSQSLMLLGVATEPALLALGALWLVRRARG
jgi:uncharacterized membrane protein YeaQ/YmgE (transglycosylase-associated protein family)